MIGRTPGPRRPAAVTASVSVLGVLACIAAALALGAAPALAGEEACANVANQQARTETELHRQESNADPNGRPYSTGLPECRAYEMVSPSYKRSENAHEAAGGGIIVGFPVAPDGDTAEFISEGVFAGLENYVGGLAFQNPYYSRRSPSGWATSSGYIPATLKLAPILIAQYYDPSSPDLRSDEGGCGFASTLDPRLFAGYGCAIRKQGGEWEASQLFSDVNSADYSEGGPTEIGASSDLSRIFIASENSLLPGVPGNQGVYEVSGLGTPAAQLRIVNVDNAGKLLTMHKDNEPATGSAPLIGDARYQPVPKVLGTAYHAISESGETVFFTAARAVSGAGTEEEHDVATLYARVACSSGPNCSFVEKEGQKVEGRETIEISKAAPEPECTATCKSDPPADATFEGASADGSQVFFTTEQKLLNGDANTTPELYEWSKGKLTLISAGEPGTTFEGVVRTSSDGSHVYFAEKGLIPATRPRTQNKNANGEEALATQENLYGYDTETGETKFVAAAKLTHLYEKRPGRLAAEEEAVNASGSVAELALDEYRRAQTTPDGRYLVFSAPDGLAGDTNAPGALAAYRYDFQTGELTWVSHAAPGVEAENAGDSAFVASIPGSRHGAWPEIDDFNRAISGCPEEAAIKPFAGCKAPGEHDGEYVIFTTNEKLQSDDANGVADVYEWHCASPCTHPATEAVVNRISSGSGINSESGSVGGSIAGNEVGSTAMSASGSDILFFTTTQLVKQDTDALADLYDARAPLFDEPAGFPAPPPEHPCSGEECQGSPSPQESFGPATSSQSAAGGNLLPPAAASLAFKVVTPKPKVLTRAQQLAKALKACKGKPRKQRAACESQARKKYAAKKAVKAKKSDRGGR